MSQKSPAPIEITVDGRAYRLDCTRQALKAINAALGGMRPALQAIDNWNWDSMALIVAAGSGGPMTAQEVDALAEAMWRENSPATVRAITDYAVRMSRGGRDPDASAAPQEGKPGNG